MIQSSSHDPRHRKSIHEATPHPSSSSGKTPDLYLTNLLLILVELLYRGRVDFHRTVLCKKYLFREGQGEWELNCLAGKTRKWTLE